jgi:hypothetical protein
MKTVDVAEGFRRTGVFAGKLEQVHRRFVDRAISTCITRQADRSEAITSSEVAGVKEVS